jgi:hypothetical protein
MYQNTTKRYKSILKDGFEYLKVKEIDLYQFGCEFEFYIDTAKHNLQDAVVQIKPDQSLEDNGIEISIPITTQNGVKHYINHVLPLIEEYGYTNEDTGLHFHISTIKQDGINFNFYLYMLMCHDKNLLSSWLPRSGYSQNVMDILSKNTKSKSREIKNKKGTIWNLEKIDSNHIEIKAIGGVDYHKEVDKIISEFDMYVKYFDKILNDTNSKYREVLINEHKQVIQSIDKSTKEEYSKAVSEAGLIN